MAAGRNAVAAHTIILGSRRSTMEIFRVGRQAIAGLQTDLLQWRAIRPDQPDADEEKLDRDQAGRACKKRKKARWLVWLSWFFANLFKQFVHVFHVFVCIVEKKLKLRDYPRLVLYSCSQLIADFGCFTLDICQIFLCGLCIKKAQVNACYGQVRCNANLCHCNERSWSPRLPFSL